MANLGRLSVSMALESAQFIRSTQQAQAATTAMANSINRSIASVRAGIGGFVSALSFDAFTEAAQRAFDYADALQDLSDKTGASTKFIQEFGYAAQMSGASVETARLGIEKFAKNLGDAISGNKAMAEEMARLGVTSKDVDTAIKQAATGISKLDTDAEKAAATAKLFGKSGIDLTKTLKDGAANLDEFARRAQELGVAIGPELIANAGAVNDQLDTMKMITDAQWSNTIIQNANAIVALNGAIADLGSALAKFWSQNPRGAMAIMGGVAGGVAGGVMGNLPGLAIGGTAGAIGGYALGDKAAQGRYKQNLKWTQLKKLEDDAHNAERDFLRRGVGRSKTNRFASIRNKARRDRLLIERGIDAGTIVTEALPRSSSGVGTGGNDGTFAPPPGTPKPSKHSGGGGPSAAQLAERERDRRAGFERDLASAALEELEARQALIPNIIESSVIEREMLTARRDEHKKDIERAVIKGDLTRTEADQLIAAEEATFMLRADLINRRENETLSREALSMAQSKIENERDQLLASKDLARSSRERREIGLRLVDLQFEQERIALEAIRVSKDATDAEKAVAQARLDALPGLKASATTSVRRDTMSPGQSFLDAIPRTTGEMSDAFENVAVNGLGSLSDGILGVIKGVNDMGDVFSNVAGSIIADLARIGIQKLIVAPLGAALFGGDSGGGLLGGLLKGKRANGGYTGAGAYLVGENGPELLVNNGPANVISNSRLRGLRGGGGASGVTINVGPITSDNPDAVRRAAGEAVMAAIPLINKQASDYTIGQLRRRPI